MLAYGKASAIAAITLLSVTVRAQQPAPTTDSMKASAASSLTFSDINVPGFDPGLKIAVLSGNPDAPGLYTLRLSFPAGYKIPPHWHPNVENLTVLSGSIQLAMGERADTALLKKFVPGDFVYIPAKHPHFGGVEGATIVQLHGEGPFTINLMGAR